MKFIKYLTVGGLAFTLEYLSFIGLIWLFDKLFIAQLISWTLGYIVSFTGHRQFTFKTKGNYRSSTKRQFILYGLVALITLSVSTLILYLLSLVVIPVIAKLISMIFTVLISYFSLSKIVFSK